MDRRERISSQRIELGYWLAATAVLFYSLREMLFTGETTLPHDNLYWYFPPFHFLADNLLNGRLPLWDPFTNGGQPFYPLLCQERLLEPWTILTILVGQFFTKDTVLLCNWNRILQNLTIALGVYLLLRRHTKDLFLRLTLASLLLFSSYFLSSFRQEGISHQFLWAPFVMIFIYKIFFDRDYRLPNWIGLGICVGVNWQSYYFAGTWMLLLFVGIAGILFYRTEMLEALRFAGNKKKAFLCATIIISMLAPNLVLLSERDRYVFPARMIPRDFRDKAEPDAGAVQYESRETVIVPALIMPYDMIKFSGTHSVYWDLLQILTPDSNLTIHGFGSHFGKPSEAYIYIGLLTWFFVLVGIFFAVDHLKKLWLVLFFGFLLVSLGPIGGLHRVLYWIYPPLWFVRNTGYFILFFKMAAFYFFLLGAQHFKSRLPVVEKFQIKNWTWREWASSLYLFAIFLCLPLLKSPTWEYAPLVLIAAVPAVATIWKSLGKVALLAIILLAHLSANLIFHPQKILYLFYLTIFLVLPIWILFRVRHRVRWFSPVLLIFATIDVFYGFSRADLVKSEQLHPSSYLSVQTVPMPHRFPLVRNVAPTYPHYQRGMPLQAPRYLPLLHRQSFAFPAIYFEEWQRAPSTQFALESRRWSTFMELRNYYDLINLPIPVIAIEEMFAIEKETLQFRPSAVNWDQPTLVQRLSEMNADDIVSFFRQNLLLDRESTQTGTVSRTFKFEIRDYHYDELKIHVQSDANGFVSWSDGYDPQWQGTVNGHPVRVERANINFKAVPIPAGKSDIVFKYRPTRFLIAVGIFFGAFFMGFAYLLFASRGKRQLWPSLP